MKKFITFLILLLFYSSAFGQVKPMPGTLVKWVNPSTKDIVGFWPFWENSGTRVFDLSGNGNNGTFGANVNSPSWSVGKFGSCLSFDGGGDYVGFGKVLIPESTDFTILVWFKTGVTHRGALIGQYTGGVKGRMTLYGTDNTNGDKLRFFVDDDADDTVLLSGSSTNDGQWHLAGVTRRGAIISLYLDGNFEASDTNADLTIEQVNFFIGVANDIPVVPFDGQVDHLIVCKYALSAFEIKRIYINRNCIFKKSQTSLWESMQNGVTIPLMWHAYKLKHAG